MFRRTLYRFSPRGAGTLLDFDCPDPLSPDPAACQHHHAAAIAGPDEQ